MIKTSWEFKRENTISRLGTGCENCPNWITSSALITSQKSTSRVAKATQGIDCLTVSSATRNSSTSEYDDAIAVNRSLAPPRNLGSTRRKSDVSIFVFPYAWTHDDFMPLTGPTGAMLMTFHDHIYRWKAINQKHSAATNQPMLIVKSHWYHCEIVIDSWNQWSQCGHLHTDFVASSLSQVTVCCKFCGLQHGLCEVMYLL